MNLRSKVIKGLQRLNLRIIKLTKEEFGVSLEYDLEKLFTLLRKQSTRIVVFDVGANIGQSVRKFKKISPESQIHTFEPSPTCFLELRNNTSMYTNIVYNNIGLGAEDKTIRFYENELTDISSFLEPTNELWGEVKSVDLMKITTLDNYCIENYIKNINYLKIDTQGYDLEVLKGASKLLKEKSIDIVQLEITLQKLYADIPQMDEVIKYLFDSGYRLVAFYGFHNENIQARWTDALFISSDFGPLNDQ